MEAPRSETTFLHRLSLRDGRRRFSVQEGLLHMETSRVRRFRHLVRTPEAPGPRGRAGPWRDPDLQKELEKVTRERDGWMDGCMDGWMMDA